MSQVLARSAIRSFRAGLEEKLATCLIFLLLAGGSGAVSAQQSGANSAAAALSTESAAATHSLVDRILKYYPVGSEPSTNKVCDLQDPGAHFFTRRFALDGRCTRLDKSNDCAYYDYRKLDLSAVSGFDQTGITSFQVTYPGTTHLFAALSIRNPPGSQFCWVGGAHVGRNPLAMTWSGDTGTKSRKNNLVLSESGLITVKNARVHNLHDTFLADSANAGIHVDGSWISWNRDDLFEGYLHDIQVTDTLVDGTYTFISDPDGECDDDKKASDKTILIENSLIRLQRQPGPYARHTGKWHWKIAGGHNTLWKLDSCDWDNWPKFTLRNNVFLIEGPRTTRKELNRLDCRLALPGECGNTALANLGECRNNLFMYTDYFHWGDKNLEPGPVPKPDGRFYNEDNPTYLPNGKDCYQRLTDDPRSAGFAEVTAIWHALRQRWIDGHSDPANGGAGVMKIPGVDTPMFQDGSNITLQNRQTGECLTSAKDGQVSMRSCDGSSHQSFQVETFDDGKLMAALLLRDGANRYLRTQSDMVLESDDSDRHYQPRVFSEASADGQPGFAERWYLLPLAESADPEDLFSIESDALGRSFLRQNGSRAEIQAFFDDGINTALPQDRFPGGNDDALQWRVVLARESAG